MGVFRIPGQPVRSKKKPGQVEVDVHDESEVLSEVISRFQHLQPLQSLKTANHQFSLALLALSVRIAYMHMMF